MAKQNNWIGMVFRINIIVTIILLLVTCKDNKMQTEADLLGEWQLSRIVVDGNQKSLTLNETDSTLNFKQIGILELSGHSGVTQRSGWNFKDGVLNIAVHLPASYYVNEITDTDMELKRLDFANGNNISITTTHFVKN